MRQMIGVLIVVLSATMAIGPTLVIAQTGVSRVSRRAERRGRAAFERGRVAFDAGQYEDALAGFAEAYRLTQRPPLLYNVGLAQDRLRQDAEALSSFERYLVAVPDSPYREQVEARITALRGAETRRQAQLAELEQRRVAAETAEAASAAESQRRAQAEAAAIARAEASQEAAEEAERQRLAAEIERAEAEERASENSPSLWWVGVLIGVVVVGAGIGIGFAVAGGDDGFAESDFGEVTETLISF